MTEDWLQFAVCPASASLLQAGLLDCNEGQVRVYQHAMIRSHPCGTCLMLVCHPKDLLACNAAGFTKQIIPHSVIELPEF